MHKVWLLPLAGALLFALADHHPAAALPVDQHGLLTTFGNGPNAPPAEFTQRRGRGVVIRGGGGRRAVAVRGPYGRRAVAVRGPYGRRAVAVRGPYGRRAIAVRGPYRVGRRYYGGIWYGPGRRYWGGRWWAYGAGSCWRRSPIGYVWVCG
jgi:hypothetical protein